MKDKDEDLFNNTKFEEFDELLDFVGSEGKFQKTLVYAVLLPLSALGAYFFMNGLFLLYVPDHWCTVPGKDSGTDVNKWKNFTLPTEVGADGHPRLSQCSMYDSNRSIVECQYGWEYDKTDYDITIPSQFDWVCNKSNYAADTFAVMAVGNTVGTVVFGIAADRVGRKPVFLLTCLINGFFRSLSLFVAQNHMIFLSTVFMAGTASALFSAAPCMIAAELCSKEYRSWAYTSQWLAWVIGNSSLPLIAWLCRDWFWFGMITSVPGIFLLFYYGMIPESPRWLISVGRAQEATKVIMKIAKTNGTSHKISLQSLGENIQTLCNKQKEMDIKDKQRNDVFALFCKPHLAKNTVLLCISYSMSTMIYLGLTLNTTNMAGNQFLNYFYIAIIELPSGWWGGILLEKAGRRWTLTAFFLLCTVSFFVAAIAVLYPSLSSIVTISVVAANFGNTVTSLVVFILTAELFPTNLRSTGFSLAATVSSVLWILGPYIVYLRAAAMLPAPNGITFASDIISAPGTLHASVPYCIFCGMGVLGMITSACLPETYRQKLPETIEDANNFGKGQTFWSMNLVVNDNLNSHAANETEIEMATQK